MKTGRSAITWETRYQQFFKKYQVINDHSRKIIADKRNLEILGRVQLYRSPLDGLRTITTERKNSRYNCQ